MSKDKNKNINWDEVLKEAQDHLTESEIDRQAKIINRILLILLIVGPPIVCAAELYFQALVKLSQK